MEIKRSLFGGTKEGADVMKYTLINDHGYSVSVITYGGTITEINVPDKNGVIGNVTLNCDSMKNYYEEGKFLGRITGPFAGRISGASFTINGKTYTLTDNDSGNCLHSAEQGFDKMLWSATEISETGSVGIALHFVNEPSTHGFPGTVDTTVIYKWNNDNELTIQYIATTDEETLLAITNHAYFNLSGKLNQPILDHILQVDADRYIEVNEKCIPKAVSPVAGTPFDFRNPKAVGQDIELNHEQLKNGKGYDHPFVLNGKKNPQVTLFHEGSGRKLEVSTDEEGIVIYSGNHLHNDVLLADGTKSNNRCGICLETQYFPDNANFDGVPTKTLKPGEVYRHSTTFKFSVQSL